LAAGLSSAAWLSRAVGRYYYQEEVDPSTLEPYTAEGNPYAHKLEKMYYENGHPVNVYICEKELEREWEKRSGLDYYGTDRSGNSLRYTLIRYLASRGLRKDAKGVKALSKSDIDNIESGLANYIYADKRSVYPYVYNIIWQIDMYQKGYSPAGHSVGMRFVYMKAGWHIFSQHPWLGVGTGDVRQAFGQYYEQSPHHFSPKWRKLSHNQYLTFLAAFGFFGFLLCMLAILGPVFLRHAWGHMLVSVFMAIALLSMLNEDTLEPQIGVSFFAFFYSLFIFGGFHRKNET
jgi:hypothetical protein